MKKKAGAAIRTRPETVMSTDVFRNQAVSGPTERPESRANQPFVHVEAALQPSIAPCVATVTEFRLSSGRETALTFAIPFSAHNPKLRAERRDFSPVTELAASHQPSVFWRGQALLFAAVSIVGA